MAPCVRGTCPVRIDTREGTHIGAGAYALRKRTPRAASASLLGVRTTGSPRIRARRSATRRRISGGCWGACGPYVSLSSSGSGAWIVPNDATTCARRQRCAPRDPAADTRKSALRRAGLRARILYRETDPLPDRTRRRFASGTVLIRRGGNPCSSWS